MQKARTLYISISDTIIAQESKMSTAVERANKTYEKELEKAIVQERLEKNIPKIEGVEPKFFVYPLFGTTGSITFEDVTLDQLLQIIREFSPVDLYYHKGSCSSFQILDKPKYESDKVTKVAPYVIHYKKMVSYKQKTIIKWNTMIGDDIVRVDVVFTGIQFGAIDYIGNDHRGGYTIDTRSLVGVPSPLGNHVQIKWASGGSEYINSYSIHFEPSEEPRLDFYTMIREVLKVQK